MRKLDEKSKEWNGKSSKIKKRKKNCHKASFSFICYHRNQFIGWNDISHFCTEIHFERFKENSIRIPEIESNFSSHLVTGSANIQSSRFLIELTQADVMNNKYLILFNSLPIHRWMQEFDLCLHVMNEWVSACDKIDLVFCSVREHDGSSGDDCENKLQQRREKGEERARQKYSLIQCRANFMSRHPKPRKKGNFEWKKYF